MPPYAGPPVARSDDIAGTLRLLACILASIGLMVLDHQAQWLKTVRGHAEMLVEPLWDVAGMPARLGRTVREDAATLGRLTDENEALRNALLIERARVARLQAAAAENARLRGLLGAAEQGGLDVQLAPILDIALDPNRQRLTLDIGAGAGVREGQAVIDAGGLIGQVTRVRRASSEVLLLTDPSHAVPVAVSRNGIRLVVYGRGDHLELANIPMSADVKVGDVIVTSGLGERFPPGFPVGTVARLQPDASRTFLIGLLTPAAQLDRGRDVLLLRGRQAPDAAVAGSAPTSSSSFAPATVPPPTADTASGARPGTAAAPPPAAGRPAAAGARPAPAAASSTTAPSTTAPSSAPASVPGAAPVDPPSSTPPAEPAP